MPQVFKSGNHFRFIDSLIYYCKCVFFLSLLFSVSHKHPTFAGWFMFIVCEGYIANIRSFFPGTNIEELELMTYEAEEKEDSYSKLEWNLPENYQTMVEFLELLWNGTLKTLSE
uniref:Putative ovule protein n=1 Tax=Solanum chacoense TaxID=4108 RepID=A0A0V0H1B5_SOLCH